MYLHNNEAKLLPVFIRTHCNVYVLVCSIAAYLNCITTVANAPAVLRLVPVYSFGGLCQLMLFCIRIIRRQNYMYCHQMRFGTGTRRKMRFLAR